MNYPNSEEYKWDDDELEVGISSRINGRPIEDWQRRLRIKFKLKEGRAVIIPRDLFGKIYIEDPDKKERRGTKIVPNKVFSRNKAIKLKEAYNRVLEIFEDIDFLISALVTKTRGFQALESFRALRKFLNQILDFYALMGICFSKEICKIVRDLFSYGAVHRNIMDEPSYFGGRVKLSSSPLPASKIMLRRTSSFVSTLNVMLFQSVYFTLLISLFSKRHLGSSKRARMLKEELNEAIRVCLFALNYYNLWSFYEIRPLNIYEIEKELERSQNPHYKKLVPFYLEIVRALFFRMGPQSKYFREFPIMPFPQIYEVWAISKIIKCLTSLGLQLKCVKADRKYRLYFLMEKGSKTIEIFWEMKFRPILEDSLYLGSIARIAASKGLENTSAYESGRIKPDIVIIAEGKRQKKIFIGEVKFSLLKRGGLGLPRLRDIYKILGYLNDLSNSETLRNEAGKVTPEGILIYPGTVYAKIPIELDTKGASFKIYLLPLNLGPSSSQDCSRDPSLFFKFFKTLSDEL